MVIVILPRLSRYTGILRIEMSNDFIFMPSSLVVGFSPVVLPESYCHLLRAIIQVSRDYLAAKQGGKKDFLLAFTSRRRNCFW